MVEVHFKKGDRVRVVKGDEEDLPVGFETTVTATSVEEYGVEARTQFLDLLDAAGGPRCRPAHEFELVPRSVIDAREHEARTLVERAYDLAGTPRALGKAAELGMTYGSPAPPSPDVYLETANRALAARVRQLEQALQPFYFKPEHFVGVGPKGERMRDPVSVSLDLEQVVEMHWPVPGNVSWVSFATLRDFLNVRKVLGND